MHRSLTLHRESLGELADTDLAAVAGGNQYSAAGLTCPVVKCITELTQDAHGCASGLGCPVTNTC